MSHHKPHQDSLFPSEDRENMATELKPRGLVSERFRLPFQGCGSSVLVILENQNEFSVSYSVDTSLASLAIEPKDGNIAPGQQAQIKVRRPKRSFLTQDDENLVSKVNGCQRSPEKDLNSKVCKKAKAIASHLGPSCIKRKRLPRPCCCSKKPKNITATPCQAFPIQKNSNRSGKQWAHNDSVDGTNGSQEERGVPEIVNGENSPYEQSSTISGSSEVTIDERSSRGRSSRHSVHFREDVDSNEKVLQGDALPKLVEDDDMLKSSRTALPDVASNRGPRSVDPNRIRRSSISTHGNSKFDEKGGSDHGLGGSDSGFDSNYVIGSSQVHTGLEEDRSSRKVVDKNGSVHQHRSDDVSRAPTPGQSVNNQLERKPVVYANNHIRVQVGKPDDECCRPDAEDGILRRVGRRISSVIVPYFSSKSSSVSDDGKTCDSRSKQKQPTVKIQIKDRKSTVLTELDGDCQPELKKFAYVLLISIITTVTVFTTCGENCLVPCFGEVQTNFWENYLHSFLG